MSGGLRARSGAGRLRGILVMPVRRVVSASVLSLIAVLGLVTFGTAVGRVTAALAFEYGQGVDQTIAPASGNSSPLGTAMSVATRPAKQSLGTGGRHPLHVRARATDGDGDTRLTAALPSSARALFGDSAGPERARLRRLTRSHAPYGKPSPFDATAPPVSSRRNG